MWTASVYILGAKSVSSDQRSEMLYRVWEHSREHRHLSGVQARHLILDYAGWSVLMKPCELRTSRTMDESAHMAMSTDAAWVSNRARHTAGLPGWKAGGDPPPPPFYILYRYWPTINGVATWNYHFLRYENSSTDGVFSPEKCDIYEVELNRRRPQGLV